MVPERIASSPAKYANVKVNQPRSRSPSDWQIMHTAQVLALQNNHPYHGSSGMSEGWICTARIVHYRKSTPL